MGRGKRGKSRTQRKHFQQNRENVWTSSKRSKSDPSSENPIPICNPYATQNLAFDHYYKANQTLPTYYFHTFLFYYYSPYLLLLFHLLISFLFEFFRSRESFPQKNGMHSCKFSELLCPQHSESILRISLSIFILTAFRFWPCVSHPLNYLLLTNFNTKLINLTHCKSVTEFQKNTKIIARA